MPFRTPGGSDQTHKQPSETEADLAVAGLGRPTTPAWNPAQQTSPPSGIFVDLFNEPHD